jgi:hypothetical protein
VGAGVGEKAACHSDVADAERAQHLQGELVVLRVDRTDPPPAE